MKSQTRICIGVACSLLIASTAILAQRGGRGGGGRGGGGGARMSGGGGARVSGGGGYSGARPGGGARPAQSINRTPSFSQPQFATRPAQMPARPTAGLPSQLPANRPNIGSRPAQLPVGGARPGIGDGARISTLPSTRPDIGGRPGVGRGPGISTLPALGAGAAIGAGVANRIGDRQGSLPGVGDRRPGAGQLPNRTPAERRQALQERLAGDGRPGQPPARDWNQVRQDWQQNRDQIREDWQNHRDEAREDWQEWFNDHYGRYGGWYWGYAPGYWNRWDYLWDQYPVAAAVGLTWWGVNNMGTEFGCGDYYNPYYAEGGAVSYAEPIVSLPLEAPDAPVSPEMQQALQKFDEARAAFLENDYEKTLKATDEAVAHLPHDAVLHEFRSLALFALGRYAESAAAIHAVLAVGPGWDAKTLTTLYSDMETYTKHLRALEGARNANREAADLRFLCAYHYMTCGYPDEALSEFRKAAELQPKDAVAAALIASLSPREAQAASAAAEAPKAVPRAEVVGNWTAAGKGSAKYAMDLKDDGTFTWEFSRRSKKESVKGVYSVEGNVFAMEPDTGGVLLAELTPKEPEGLHFQMIGAAKDDPGLAFQRAGAK
jgi:tetratricopeptide (TPR) repeat protein